MENRKVVTLIPLALTVFLGAAIIGYFCLKDGNKNAEARETTEKFLRFSYTLTNNSSEFIESTDFISYLPLELPGTQRVTDIISSHPYEIIVEDEIHRSIKFKVLDLAPYASRVIDLTVVVEASLHPQSEAIQKQVYVKAEKYIESDDGVIRDLAGSIEFNQFPEKKLYEWLSTNIQDIGYVAENKGARFALEHRMGDCTEHMYAFVALARAKAIPARGVAGFVVEDSAGILNSSSYHNWAEYHDGEKWILADSQKKVFDRDYKNYIAYRIFGGDFTASGSTNRFLAIDPRITIRL